MKWTQDGRSGEVDAEELLDPITQLPLAESQSEMVAGRAVYGHGTPPSYHL